MWLLSGRFWIGAVWLLALTLALVFFLRVRTERIVIAAGPKGGDSFALAFYCDPNQTTTIPVDSRSLASSIQEHFQVFLGLAQRGGGDVSEGTPEWGGMPDQSFDRSGRVRGVGTTVDGQFQAFSPSERVKEPHHFSVMTGIR